MFRAHLLLAVKRAHHGCYVNYKVNCLITDYKVYPANTCIYYLCSACCANSKFIILPIQTDKITPTKLEIKKLDTLTSQIQ